ncbi:hypothetical protein ASPTUDRAFT_116205 [Aspergillus tubingensis CBS 134.48]|uniref:Uncharacterized protein n=1 Tax=Aspergillus tubingensis (strain CBS 134.48) TaxID=767770 RepID=A0A1L9N9Q9_ASPTC|nr:hypothetical protein ASPTUDRAFT_116205 [Aspergillus tubingensis CBS 134.48]
MAERRKAPKVPKVAKGQLRVTGFKLPKSLKQLKSLLAKDGLGSKTIHEIEPGHLGSGSDINQRQYAMFRAFSTPIFRPSQLLKDMQDFGLDQTWDLARNIVNQSSEFRRYLALLQGVQTVSGLSPSSEAWPGAFKPTRDIQEQVVTVKGVSTLERSQKSRPGGTRRATTRAKQEDLSTGKKTIGRRLGRKVAGVLKRGRSSIESESDSMSQSIFFDDPDVVSSEDDDPTYVEDDDKLPDADDETSVNTALILLLKEISHLIPNIKSDWTFDHLSFSPQFKKGSYTAITDGGLRSKTNQAIMYIIEAKRRVSSQRYEEIVMQEAAELVGWIQHGDSPRPELKGHLALLSGDRHQIFVTFASCSPDYQAYLNPEIGHATSDTHMKMQTYGPYNTLVNRHMEDFAVVVVSLMLLAEKAL